MTPTPSAASETTQTAVPETPTTKATLVLEDGSEFHGLSFGADRNVSGEVVFSTGMVGYPEALTDPSFYGQLLTLTFPLVGNYGVPNNEDHEHLADFFESSRVQIAGLLVSDYSVHHHHWQAFQSLANWLKRSGVPGIMGLDTRAITKRLREKGAMLGKIVFEGQADVPYYDPNSDQLLEKVSIAEKIVYGTGDRTIALLDCGCKESIAHNISSKGFRVIRLPWNTDLKTEKYDALLISSGPGDPRLCNQVIHQIRNTIREDKPILGICLGHQMLGLAAGGQTFKLKYGHRSQNQPVRDTETGKCYITSQNHGYAVDAETLPSDWKAWFTNLNDGTNEGLKHVSKPIRSTQFHPEANPGPVDTQYIFEQFLQDVGRVS